MSAAASFDGEQKRESSPQLPGRSISRTYRVVIGGNLCVDRLITHSEDPTEAAANRHSPLLAPDAASQFEVMMGAEVKYQPCAIL